MCSIMIQLHSIKELHSFIDIINEYPGSYEIAKGSYAVNAKSLMTLLSLDLSKPFKLIISSENADEVLNKIQPYILHE